MGDDFLDELISGKSNKKKATFSIDEKLLIEFTKLSNGLDFKKSPVVEKLIRSFVEKQKSLL